MKRLAALVAVAGLVGCYRPVSTSHGVARSGPTVRDAAIEKAGLHNVYRITNSLYSGSVPEGDVGFRSLQELGIRTVLSVDGARPDLATAHKYGMRYVHIPFGYDGIPTAQLLRLAKAARDLPGPVYVHCHHGKHRGPAAAAAIHMCLDETCSVDQALAEMKRSGTDPHYTGLYAVPRSLERPRQDVLDRISPDFPEVVEVSSLAQIMVAMDERWANLQRIRAAGWKTPPGHADLDPPHEALQLVEHGREAARLASVQERPDEFRQWLAAAEANATGLESALRRRATASGDHGDAAEAAFQSVGNSCSRCHAKYRDVPQGR